MIRLVQRLSELLFCFFILTNFAEAIEIKRYRLVERNNINNLEREWILSVKITPNPGTDPLISGAYYVLLKEGGDSRKEDDPEGSDDHEQPGMQIGAVSQGMHQSTAFLSQDGYITLSFSENLYPLTHSTELPHSAQDNSMAFLLSDYLVPVPASSEAGVSCYIFPVAGHLENEGGIIQASQHHETLGPVSFSIFKNKLKITIENLQMQITLFPLPNPTSAFDVPSPQQTTTTTREFLISSYPISYGIPPAIRASGIPTTSVSMLGHPSYRGYAILNEQGWAIILPEATVSITFKTSATSSTTSLPDSMPCTTLPSNSPYVSSD